MMPLSQDLETKIRVSESGKLGNLEVGEVGAMRKLERLRALESKDD